MSMEKSELHRRLESAGFAIAPPRPAPKRTQVVALIPTAVIRVGIPIAKELLACGGSLRDAHAAINVLVQQRPATCAIDAEADLAKLSEAMKLLNIWVMPSITDNIATETSP